jgi:hypothetical protein
VCTSRFVSPVHVQNDVYFFSSFGGGGGILNSCSSVRFRRQVTYLWADLGISRADLLPGRGGVRKVAERLGELQWLIHNPLLLLVVSHFRVSLQ